MSEKKLVRYQHDRMIFGVASGLADYLAIDVTIIRLLFVVLMLAGGPGILVYLVLAIVMPEANDAPVAKGTVLDEEEIVIKEG